MIKKILYLLAGLLVSLGFHQTAYSQVKASAAVPGDLIKASQPAVYYYGADGKRYVFPNEKTYFTWYRDFSGVKLISDAELGAIQIGGNVTYKPGSRLLKITTDPKVYWVDQGGTLRAITSEVLASQLFGASWNKKIDDLPDPFFVNYKVGADLTAGLPSIPANLTIGADKGLATAPPLPAKPQTFNVDIKNFTFSPSVVTIKKGDTVVWTNDDSTAHQIAPDDASCTDLNSAVLGLGGSFSLTFNQSGTYNYHCAIHPSMTGQVIVQ